MKLLRPFYTTLVLFFLFAFQLNAQQLKLLNLVQPYAVTFSGTNQNVIVEFKNVGAVTVNSAQFKAIQNSFGVTDSINTFWGGSLAPGSSTSVNIGSFTIAAQTNELEVNVWDINGTGTSNVDTAKFKIQTPGVLNIPYTDDFEGVLNWSPSSSFWLNGGINPNGWQVVVPNYGVITPTTAGSNAWALGFNSGYGDSLLTYLYSPVFNFAASGINSIWLHFTANANLASNDSLTVEYTTDFLTWTQLPAAVTITGNNGGWWGYGTGLSFLASEPQVQFRFVFNSDNSGTADGIAIDDFEVIQCVISQINLNQLTPISCFGGCDGVLEASPQVGFPPFTYLWNTGETTQTISNVCAGNYSVTVTDVNGCTGQTGQTVFQPTPIIFNLGPDVSICLGDSAVICASATGGTPPYSYIWNTGAITSCITVTTSGSYSLTVVDASGCSVTDIIVITVNLNPVINLGPDVFICDGASAILDAGPGFAGYQWSTGEVTQTILVTSGGTYTATVTNFNGCTGSDDITVTQSSPIIVTPHEAFNCLTLSTDSIYVDVTGGTFPNYVYIWSNGNSTNVIDNPLPGVYTITVADMNGCTGSASLTVYGSLNLSLTKTDPECFGYPGTISAVMNGTPPFSYQWSNGATIQQPFNTFAGTYTVTVTDGNGCTLSATDSLIDPDPVVLSIDSVIASGCGASNGAFYYSFTPPGFSIPWINGVQFATSNNLPNGVYNIYIVQNVCASNTVTVVVPDSCEDVWPGDANYDLVADNKDLLQIGLAYGNTGPVRPVASNTWVAQACPDWSNWFNIGVNHKHADCDGNGLIEAADTIPILLNYGLTHPLKPIIIPQVNTVAPDLFLVITQDTTGLSDSVFISVMCGSAANPVDSIYGLAFTLYYDSALVDTNSVSFNYSNSFLGTAGLNLISISKNFGVGYADFAITRTDHSNATGFGPVAVMGIVTTDNVAGKFLNPVNTTLQFSLGNVYALTANENPITLDAFGDSVFIDSTLNGINYLNWDAAVRVYPNPANNYFTVASSLTNISKITIMNQLGEIVYSNLKPHLPQNINVAAIPNGVYVLRVETKDGVMHRKIQIIR